MERRSARWPEQPDPLAHPGAAARSARWPERPVDSDAAARRARRPDPQRDPSAAALSRRRPDPPGISGAAARSARWLPPGLRREPNGAVHPLGLVAVAMLAPAVAAAHERWVPHTPRFPIDRSYFQSMTGEVLLYSLAATLSVFGVVVLWYLFVPPIVEALTPVTPAARAREAQRNPLARALRFVARLALDGDVPSRFMRWGLVASTFVFSKIPALVLALGAYEGWLVMPSYPLPKNELGDALRIASGVLALWAASGLFLPVLGGVFLAVFVYLCFAYDIAAIDAIPVLASAFFYLFHRKKQGVLVNARQLLGMRVALGVGFFLLGVVNKIYLAEIFIGVGDNHPDIVAGPQAIFPGLTREAWSFTTALGEMVFGLLLLLGVFNRITTLALALIFGNFIFVFGWAEIVHVYPIAGFVLLFFRGPLGTSLDGIVFRTTVRLFRWFRLAPGRLVYGGAVTSVATTTALGLFLTPLVLVTEVVPVLAGTAVPAGYKPPPPAPPASTWAKLPPPKPHADHAPRHGGVVMMNGDIHVEMVVRPDGTVLLWLSDEIRRPIAPTTARGTVKIARPGFAKVVPVAPDASGALVAVGPAPTVKTSYTYALDVGGRPASTTLAVPPGGTAALQR